MRYGYIGNMAAVNITMLGAQLVTTVWRHNRTKAVKRAHRLRKADPVRKEGTRAADFPEKTAAREPRGKKRGGGLTPPS